MQAGVPPQERIARASRFLRASSRLGIEIPKAAAAAAGLVTSIVGGGNASVGIVIGGAVPTVSCRFCTPACQVMFPPGVQSMRAVIPSAETEKFGLGGSAGIG